MKRTILITLALLALGAAAAFADECAPGKVTTIYVGKGKTTATVLWTNTGDDCATGDATSYEVRRSTGTITDTNWQSASIVASGSADANGTDTCVSLSGLSCGTTYYYAVFLIDEAGNRSPLSTVVSMATKACNQNGEVICP